MSARPALLLVNRASGRQRGARFVPALERTLAAAGFDARVETIATPPEAREHAARAAERGDVEVVAVLGGDGTVRGAAAGLLGSTVALAPLPGGTTNVVSAALGFPPRPLAAAAALATAVPRAIDVGLVDGEPFLMQVSAGIDARIMAKVGSRLKTHLGRGGVVLQGLSELWSYPFPAIEVEADGRRYSATHVAICNLPHYAGGFHLVPGGSCEDRQLELVLFGGRGRRALLRYGWGIVRARHTRLPDVTVLPVTEVAILGPADASVQVDGDPLREALPVFVRLAGDRLRVLAPPDEDAGAAAGA